jgi:hypothetical protein
LSKGLGALQRQIMDTLDDARADPRPYRGQHLPFVDLRIGWAWADGWSKSLSSGHDHVAA